MPYLRARFDDDPHLWLTALYDEVIALGNPRSYPTFVRSVRPHGLRPHCLRPHCLRPHCEPRHGVRGRLTIETAHPPGEEIGLGLVRTTPGALGRHRGLLHLYGVERGGVEHIMESFWIVRDLDNKEHGAFLTKELILEAYDSMATSTPGASFRTRLELPPGHQSLAHSVPNRELDGGWAPWEGIMSDVR